MSAVLYHAALCCIAERNRTKTVYLFSMMYDTAVAQRKGWLIKNTRKKSAFYTFSFERLCYKKC